MKNPSIREKNILNRRVLVLNQDYTPLNVCQTRRALLLLFSGKAEVVQNDHSDLHGPAVTIKSPSVIRLGRYVKRKNVARKLTRREIFFRDENTCQYCGKASHELTLDHVYPRHRGGLKSWSNMVSACVQCNFRKAGRTPEEAGMKLLNVPRQPSLNPYYPFYRYLGDRPEWRYFFPVEMKDSVSR